MEQQNLHSKREELGTDLVRTRFGEITPEILKKSDYERVCITRDKDGLAGSYSIVYFDKRGVESFPSVHQEINHGRFIGESFRKLGIPLVRDERCSFAYPAPPSLTKLFGVPKALCFAKGVELKAGESSIPYASIIELYSPLIGFAGLHEREQDEVLATVGQLDDHFSTRAPYFIREVTRRGLDQYLDLAHEFLKKPMHVGIPNKQEFVNTTRNTGEALIEDPNTILLVAQQRDDLVGYLAANVHPALHVNGQECALRELYVKEGDRRQGVGSSLIEIIERMAVERGARRCSLATDMSNEMQSRFYTSQGYRRRCDFVVKYLGQHETTHS